MAIVTCEACQGKGCLVCNFNGWYSTKKTAYIFKPDYVPRNRGGQPGKKRIFSYSEKQQIIDMYQDGYSQAEITAELETDHRYIRKILKAAGVKIRQGLDARKATYLRRKRDEVI